ncbi:hypothetical protein [Methylobrevis albus]|uniref:Uncharacterized protein n=1 Tax=Methylobrevis albus TaxID=2793297 RepID=A0A931MZV6_9HYPH|nr:hypothetical protein [Methylobrevis albus]MBH0239812.1 hypothetical protein [Methylobrevis albus]
MHADSADKQRPLVWRLPSSGSGRAVLCWWSGYDQDGMEVFDLEIHGGNVFLGTSEQAKSTDSIVKIYSFVMPPGSMALFLESIRDFYNSLDEFGDLSRREFSEKIESVLDYRRITFCIARLSHAVYAAGSTHLDVSYQSDPSLYFKIGMTIDQTCVLAMIESYEDFGAIGSPRSPAGTRADLQSK